MSDFDENEERLSPCTRTVLIIACCLLIGGAILWIKSRSNSAPSARPERIVTVSLPPPPPRPLPTPPPMQPEKTVENKKTTEDAPKLDAPKPEPPKAPDEPPPSLGSNIKGDGSDGFGLSGSGNGGRVGFGGNGRGGGNGYGAFAAPLQSRLAEALRQDPQTRASTFDLQVKVWVDSSGTVTRAEPGAERPVARIIGV